MERIGRLAGLGGPELRATFNGGIGMALVVGRAEASDVLRLLGSRGQEAWIIGEVVPVSETGSTRYREDGG
jgi:phosphoribosylformylglycinamidine cyclo-ligase